MNTFQFYLLRRVVLLSAFLFIGYLSLLTPSAYADNQNALNFDGVDDYVKTASIINYGSNLTYEAWIKTSSTSDWGGIVTTFTGSDTAKHYFQLATTGDGYLRADWKAGQGAYWWLDATTTRVNDGHWHYVAATLNSGAMSIHLYVDGIEQALVTRNYVNGSFGTVYIDTPIVIGRHREITGWQSFNGTIDEVRVWKATLPQWQIQSNMYNGVDVPHQGLWAYYRFNQGVPGGNNAGITSAVDISGNAITSTLYNFSLIGDTSNWVAGYNAYTVRFDTQGGTPTPSNQAVVSGGKVSKPQDPTKTGYTFAGWYNGASAWNFNADIVANDMTLTAYWTVYTSTPTDTPTDIPTDTPTATATNTPTDTPTNTPTDTPTFTPTCTPTDTPTATSTDMPTDTPTNTPTNTPTDTPPLSLFVFLGFHSPVDNLPTINAAKAGQTIPMKWSLQDANGNYVSDLAAVVRYGYGSLDTCSGSTDTIEEYADAGSIGLRYDADANQFILTSKTDKAWAGTCKTFTLIMSDGTKHQANFKFRK